ncbi:hypothetical protein [Paenisporosarcina indica]|uniref:hypothetical protein n=1 Tax=Paenisporosarcina indica TaxID=650093 RepID=UPI00094F59FA|nr:hypothetical protein [Paenisporosarcina indica]
MENTPPLKSLKMERIYVCLWDDENLVSSNNHAVGLAEMPTDRKLARFKEVALIDPDFIAFSDVGEVLIFEDMEFIVLENNKAEMSDECIEEEGY